MCSTMIELHTEHAGRVLGGGEGLGEEATAFFERRCEAEAFANHVEHSISLHDEIHREVHAGGHEGRVAPPGRGKLPAGRKKHSAPPAYCEAACGSRPNSVRYISA